jgi:hypothetical protein
VPEPTREELLAEVLDLRAQLAQRPVQQHAQPHAGPGERTVIRETPKQTTIETKLVPPTARVRAAVVQPRTVISDAAPSDILARITALKTVIASGVEGAGYGDKRTDFRSLAELRQILNDLEDDLAASLGFGGRPRQIRMTTQWDKGL